MAQFAASHSLPATIEHTDGSCFLKSASGRAAVAQKKLSFATIDHTDYDTIPYVDTTLTHSSRILRVDEIEGLYRGPRGKTEWFGQKKDLRTRLEKMKQVDGHVSLSDVEKVMGQEIGKGLEGALQEIGWVVAYTFNSPDELDSSKSPTWNEEQAIDINEVRGQSLIHLVWVR